MNMELNVEREKELTRSKVFDLIKKKIYTTLKLIMSERTRKMLGEIETAIHPFSIT
tara:strand:- start:347 stop:514 length:168 start_codon:yes stop_codon:yes gene_type:complete